MPLFETDNKSGERKRRIFFDPISFFIHLSVFKNLIYQFALREVYSRYRGSLLGIAWTFLQPLFMLCVYTFVFSVVFNAKWGKSHAGGNSEFALVLFVGIITFNIIGDVISSAPTLILSNVNLVKKVIFPLEILPVVKLIGVLVNAFVGLLIALLGILLVWNEIHLTALLLPFAWLPVIFFALGCCYFISALGVFLRDVQPTVGVLVTVMFFLSPIFYPLEAVPEAYRIFCTMNPIAIYVETSRSLLLWGMIPDLTVYAYGFAISLVVFIFGLAFFLKAKNTFADVI
ncbi:ABC transporter permease [Desulforegula conservatrix]|uniref:ABC transporter permease n=1 Tax=Desulforegula conservatrix TaxID=153026 RepID=UPI000402AD78|nr:ABC transporter permease [Desulforegula conservatrix]